MRHDPCLSRQRLVRARARGFRGARGPRAARTRGEKEEGVRRRQVSYDEYDEKEGEKERRKGRGREVGSDREA